MILLAIALSAPWGQRVEAQTAPRKIYVANFASDTLSVFPINANGNAKSLFTETHLNAPQGIAWWGGNLYVANNGNDSVTAYPANATGRPEPIITIKGSKTQLNNPSAIALDSSGNIYVLNDGASGDPGIITVYSARSDDDVEPKAVIKGPNARLDGASAIAVDARGNLYVTVAPGDERSEDAVLIFSAGTNGNVSPARTISGPKTRVRLPGGIAVSPKGFIYVTSQQDKEKDAWGETEILVFPGNASGDVAPLNADGGYCDPARFFTSGSLAVDSNGRIYLGTTGIPAQKIIVFEDERIEDTQFGQSEGICWAAKAIISPTGDPFDAPSGIAVDPIGNVYVPDSQANRVEMYPVGSNGTVKPLTKLDGETGILAPTDVTLDASGKIYMVNDGIAVGLNNSVAIFPAGTDANASPLATILEYDPDNTNLSLASLVSPQAIAVAPDGTMYVANDGSIAVFAAGSSGKAPPIRTIRGPRQGDLTGLHSPGALALDSDGFLYVLNTDGGPTSDGSITVYSPKADGNVRPVRSIVDLPGSNRTGMKSAAGMALDSKGNIYVTNNSSIGGKFDSITVYAAGASGNVAPMAVITDLTRSYTYPQA